MCACVHLNVALFNICRLPPPAHPSGTHRLPLSGLRTRKQCPRRLISGLCQRRRGPGGPADAEIMSSELTTFRSIPLPRGQLGRPCGNRLHLQRSPRSGGCIRGFDRFYALEYWDFVFFFVDYDHCHRLILILLLACVLFFREV